VHGAKFAKKKGVAHTSVLDWRVLRADRRQHPVEKSRLNSITESCLTELARLNLWKDQALDMNLKETDWIGRHKLAEGISSSAEMSAIWLRLLTS